MPPSERPVRTRIAPSPTGEPHIGTLYASLFCKAFAVQRHGRFILRLEDTDRTRFVPSAVQSIPEALRWVGLDPDEGPEQGGEYGPYVQTERLPSYREYGEELVKRGGGYYCFCTPERLEDMRPSGCCGRRWRRAGRQSKPKSARSRHCSGRRRHGSGRRRRGGRPRRSWNDFGRSWRDCAGAIRRQGRKASGPYAAAAPVVSTPKGITRRGGASGASSITAMSGMRRRRQTWKAVSGE
jgi:glutamyl/glutaminyl-tRNA synthetase